MKMMQPEFQKQLLQSQLEAREYSFNQISKELHDNIGQLLSSTKMLLGIAEMELDVVPDTLRTAEKTLSKAIQDVRTLSKSLDKEWLHEFNLIENLEAEKERINAAQKIEAELKSDYEKLPLEPEMQVMLFCIIQEALQNSIRRASPTHIAIEIKSINDYLKVSINDDGGESDIEAEKNESIDLHNMKYRTQLLGGTIEWETGNEKSRSTVITIPFTIDHEN
jgi:signal transduction histidine kinase